MNQLKLAIIFCLLVVVACNSESKKNNQTTDSTKVVSDQKIEVNYSDSISILPNDKLEFKIGDKIDFTVAIPASLKFDSLVFDVNNQRLTNFTKAPYKYAFNSQKSKVGSNKFTVNLFMQGMVFRKSLSFTFLSDIVPQNYSYRVIKTYPHDVAAYTQGLFIDNGILYEATGLEGQSTLRKNQLETGQVLQGFTVPDRIFGEGITLFNNRIIQLSWRDHIGFVYNKETFDVIEKFNYSTEGWGLTNDGQKLIMSDGSEKLYFLEPQSYSKIGEIEVCDNKGSVKSLNELEYIDGLVYANVYQTDNIAIIDIKTGKVTGWINLKGILPDEDRTRETDVLNGIAYDFKKKKLFVTGKKWPKLFEIQLVKK